jgi:hypothetical protein
MKKIVYYVFLVSITIVLSGCSKNIGQPKVDANDTYIEILEPVDGYYENKVGTKKELKIDKDSLNLKYRLLRWPIGNHKTICSNYINICLIDTLNNEHFSHSAVMGRETLFPLVKNVKYSELKKLDMPIIFHDNKIKVGINTVHIPELNTISTKEVGDSMYEKINQYVFDTYTVKINQEILGMEFYDNYDLLVWSQNDYKSICSKKNDICLLDTNHNGTFSHYVEIGSYVKNNQPNILPLDKQVTYKTIQNINYKNDSFKYQALYQGKVGNKIKISFREFNDNMARPAFTQDIEYELESNNPTIIGFKGLRIKVIKVTNQNITYSVIKDYN